MIEMVNAFVSGILRVFVWNTFELMLIGILVGFFIGILPGLGGFTALALMLPFVVKMNPFEAFAFLIGMAAVVNTTGDITSILVGIPGEPTCVATIFDGHPMAKKGEAGRALGAALMSSLVGAIFGAFALAMCIPIVRPLVLALGSPELFMLAILGLTFVTSLSGEGAIIRGLISGGIGLFLATIGQCPITGVQRYTFGLTFLWDGIGLVAIALGFFAIPEIVDLAIQRTSIAREEGGKLSGVMEGIKDTFRYFGLVIRCSAIGTFMAFVPGLGAGTSQWVAYAHAVQSAKTPEERAGFGKGDVRGVLGPGAANNSALGGQLTTTLAFGVPAGISMAILLGAFLIQGIVAGPDMLIPEAKGGHLTLTFSFVWFNVVSNIVTVAACLLILNQLVKITKIRGSLMVPFIISLVYLGAFAEQNAFEDVYIMLIFGGLGLVMVRLNWPRPPLVLGLVLGSMAEGRLFLSINNYGLAWLSRPGVLVIIALTLVGASYPGLRARWQKAKIAKDEPSAPKAISRDETKLSRFSWATVVNVTIVAMMIFALWKSMYFDSRTGLFPWVIGLAVLILAIVQLIMDFMGKGGRGGDDYLKQAGYDLSIDIVNRRTVGIFGWIIGYCIMIWLFGFSIGLSLCSFFHLKIGGREKWPLTLILTGFTWAFIHCLFDLAMHIPFPTGKLWLLLKVG
jgi:putative tricarboxylic transport membrane protein